MGSLPKATSRKDFIKRCRQLGWTGPHKGVGDHPRYMERNGKVIKIPNPHGKRSDIGEGLLKSLLREGGMTADEWLGKDTDDKDDTQAGRVTSDVHSVNSQDHDDQPRASGQRAEPGLRAVRGLGKEARPRPQGRGGRR